jgi:hypothetical protein
MKGTRGARLVALLIVAGCGARTELLGDTPDDVSGASGASDAGGISNDGASEGVDASTRDSGAATDATVFDATTIDGSSADGSVLDAGFDSGGITTFACTATAPTRIADGISELDQIAIDSRSVYFHDDDGLHRVGKSGGAVVSVAPLKNYNWPDLTAFAANEDGVTFWQVNPGAKGATVDVSHVGPFGGAPHKIATAQGPLYYGTMNDLDQVFLMFGGPAYPGITEIAPDGTTSPVASTGMYTDFVRSDDVDTYFASESLLYRSNAGGLAQVGATQSGMFIIGFVFDGPTIYFIADDSTQDIVVGSMAKQGGMPSTTLWTSNGVALGGMDQDESFVYVVDRFKPAIVRIHKDGSGVDDAVVGAKGESFTDVKVDDRCVYYSYSSPVKGVSAGVFAAPK